MIWPTAQLTRRLQRALSASRPLVLCLLLGFGWLIGSVTLVSAQTAATNTAGTTATGTATTPSTTTGASSASAAANPNSSASDPLSSPAALSAQAAQDQKTTAAQAAIAQKSTCIQTYDDAYKEGRKLAMYNQLAKDEQWMRYDPSAAMAATCVNQMIKYVRQFSQTVDKINAMAGASSVLAAAIILVATQIIDAVVEQLIQDMMNMICQAVNESIGALDSVMRNAVCLPSIGGLNHLGFNVNLDLGRTSCSGWAINPLGVVGQVSGTAPDGTALTAPIVSGAPITGLGGISYASSLPTSFRTGTSMADSYNYAGDEGDFFDFVNGDGDDQLTEDDGTGQAGSIDGYSIADAIAALDANALDGSAGACAKYVRLALEAGGLDTTGHPTWAANYGPFLEDSGFSAISSSNYAPQAGDIIVSPPYPGDKTPYGHIAMYDGSKWVSDFVQRDQYANSGYRAAKGGTIYRAGGG